MMGTTSAALRPGVPQTSSQALFSQQRARRTRNCGSGNKSFTCQSFRPEAFEQGGLLGLAGALDQDEELFRQALLAARRAGSLAHLASFLERVLDGSTRPGDGVPDLPHGGRVRLDQGAQLRERRGLVLGELGERVDCQQQRAGLGVVDVQYLDLQHLLRVHRGTEVAVNELEAPVGQLVREQTAGKADFLVEGGEGSALRWAVDTGIQLVRHELPGTDADVTLDAVPWGLHVPVLLLPFAGAKPQAAALAQLLSLTYHIFVRPPPSDTMVEAFQVLAPPARWA